MDLVRSGGDLVKADVFESLELLLARAGLVGGGQIVDADIVVLGIDAESDQDVELELSNPGWDGLLALWMNQLERGVVRDLDRWGWRAGEGA